MDSSVTISMPSRFSWRPSARMLVVRAFTVQTVQSDPAAVPEPVVAAVAHQLGIDDPGVLAGYRDMPVRWRHTAEIRDRYGYRDFATQPGRFAFTAWLYRQAWADEVASSVLFLPPTGSCWLGGSCCPATAC